ncbi:MAG: Tat pathway signal protein, partial [Candidatus Electrothrix sp. AR4]|nr:Tat pathway signal protein [Candidatus Electrothrix sp. AR4]
MKKTNTLSRRNLLKLGAVSLAGSALPLTFGTKTFAAQPRTPFKPVRNHPESDLHVDIKGKNDIKMGEVSAECLRRSVADLNQEGNLAFVLVPGDLLLDGELENAQVVRDSLDQLTVPYYVVAGNHDYIPADPKHRRTGFNYLSIEEFARFFKGHGYDDSGKRYYAREITPGLRLIGLETCLPLEIGKWGGLLPEAQMRWLDQELTDHADALNLIFMHHNVIRWSPDEQKGGNKESFCIDNDAEVKKLLAKHAQAAPVVLSGHRHIGLHLKELNNVNYFTIPSLNSHPMRYAVFTLSPQS